MKVLLVGGGGREHALAWKLAQDPSVSQLYALPGNPGIAQTAQCHPDVASNPDSLLQFAQEFGVDLTVIGPEAPLVAGVVDRFRSRGLRIVGPTEVQARLEGSKIFAKQFFADHGIPTAKCQIAHSFRDASGILDRCAYPVVLKVDGLAAGKGVVTANDRGEANEAVQNLGCPLVIEEYLTGEEVSFIALSDGKDVSVLEPCQDHKRIFDNDRGPNTGGMGAYCDSRILTAEQRDRILEQIVLPTVRATGFTGFLYAGLIMTADGPKLLEYNVRLGDPEAQVILHRLVADFGQLLLAASESRLRTIPVEWRPEPSVCVVMAAGGYPGPVRSGDAITGIEAASSAGVQVFQAATRVGNSGLETAGGRVLGVTARGRHLPDAIEAAYAGVRGISFEGAQFRNDIGRKGLSRWPDSRLQ